VVTAVAAVEREDLADVVGEEALAERRRSEDRTVGEVIDLNEHDGAGHEGGAERLGVGGVRSATG